MISSLPVLNNYFPLKINDNGKFRNQLHLQLCFTSNWVLLPESSKIDDHTLYHGSYYPYNLASSYDVDSFSLQLGSIRSVPRKLGPNPSTFLSFSPAHTVLDKIWNELSLFLSNTYLVFPQQAEIGTTVNFCWFQSPKSSGLLGQDQDFDFVPVFSSFSFSKLTNIPISLLITVKLIFKNWFSSISIILRILKKTKWSTISVEFRNCFKFLWLWLTWDWS